MRTDIETAINRTRRRLGLEHTTMHEAALRTYVDEGVNHIYTPENYVISSQEIDIECGRGALPTGCDEVIAIAPVRDENGTCCLCGNGSGEAILHANTLMSTRACMCLPYYVSDKSVLFEMGGLGVSCGINTNIFYTQSGYLILNASAEGTMKIWYKGKNVDCDGVMIIDEDWLRGVSAYAAYQFASSGMNFNKYNYRQMKDWQVEWTAQKANQSALGQRKHFKKNKARFLEIASAIVARPINALIPSNQ